MAEAGDRGKVTILVVDDDPTILRMVSLSLGKRGYQIVTATSGELALEAVKGQPPNLVILDVMMPGMSGWEVARALRKDRATAATKIIMLTAIGKEINEMTSPLYGVDAYLDKPFEFRELERIIAELVGV